MFVLSVSVSVCVMMVCLAGECYERLEARRCCRLLRKPEGTRMLLLDRALDGFSDGATAPLPRWGVAPPLIAHTT